MSGRVVLNADVVGYSKLVADDVEATSSAMTWVRQVVGEMALLDSEPRSASVTALTPLTLLTLVRDDFNEILAEKAEIAQGIIKVLTRRLRATPSSSPLAPMAAPSSGDSPPRKTPILTPTASRRSPPDPRARSTS